MKNTFAHFHIASFGPQGLHVCSVSLMLYTRTMSYSYIFPYEILLFSNSRGKSYIQLIHFVLTNEKVRWTEWGQIQGHRQTSGDISWDSLLFLRKQSNGKIQYPEFWKMVHGLYMQTLWTCSLTLKYDERAATKTKADATASWVVVSFILHQWPTVAVLLTKELKCSILCKSIDYSINLNRIIAC